MFLMFCVVLFLLFLVTAHCFENVDFFTKPLGPYDQEYGYFSESQRLEMLEETKKMFYFGYDNYMKYAFPLDELDPIHCCGRGPDHENPSNININDVLGDYALTLVDSLDTLAIFGNASEFQSAVKLVIEHVSFDKNSTVQVFEATIRVVGSLLSAHLLIVDDVQRFGDIVPAGYDGELLSMAHDLAARLMPAFDHTATGIPYPRVNLRSGVPSDCTNETCTAGAGTLLLEFGILSNLLEDPVYESVARRAMNKLWLYRSNVTGLFGNVIDIQTGEWKGRQSGLGAGLDSYFEYMFKAFIMFGNETDFRRFNETYQIIQFYMRKGRKECNSGTGFPPIYVNVDMKNGETLNNWVDSLQAAWAGLQVLAGDLEEAICSHALFYSLWQKFDALPERFNWHLKSPEVFFYPLRPELVESTYLLYQATRNPFYLHVGKHILNSLNNHTKVKCGYATIHDVRNKDLEDRMESFFLSETCKYLYLLFDEDNPVNKHADYIFSTEGHIFRLHSQFRKKTWQDENVSFDGIEVPKSSSPVRPTPSPSKGASASDQALEAESTKVQSNQHALDSVMVVSNTQSNRTYKCNRIPDERRYFLPIRSRYFQQLETLVGLHPESSSVTSDQLVVPCH